MQGDHIALRPQTEARLLIRDGDGPNGRLTGWAREEVDSV